MKTITINGIEYETETHDFDKKLPNIIIPKGWRLWKPSECYMLWENETTRIEFNLQDCWFFVEQCMEEQKEKGSVAWFVAYSDRAILVCDRDPQGSDSALGVRFCRDVKQ